MKTAEQWVCKAVAKNDIREWVNYLYAHDGYLYGTDGHMMHRVKTTLINGYYNPLTMLPAPHITRNCPIIDKIEYFFPSISHGDVVGIDEASETQQTSRLSLKWSCSVYSFDHKKVMTSINNDVAVKLHIDNDKLRGVSEFGQFIIMRH